jgi:hypothetical protein
MVIVCLAGCEIGQRSGGLDCDSRLLHRWPARLRPSWGRLPGCCCGCCWCGAPPRADSAHVRRGPSCGPCTWRQEGELRTTAARHESARHTWDTSPSERARVSQQARQRRGGRGGRRLRGPRRQDTRTAAQACLHSSYLLRVRSCAASVAPPSTVHRPFAASSPALNGSIEVRHYWDRDLELALDDEGASARLVSNGDQ